MRDRVQRAWPVIEADSLKNALCQIELELISCFSCFLKAVKRRAIAFRSSIIPFSFSFFLGDDALGLPLFGGMIVALDGR